MESKNYVGLNVSALKEDDIELLQNFELFIISQ